MDTLVDWQFRRMGFAMRLIERIGRPLLRALDPETAHTIATWALRAGMGPDIDPSTSPRLKVSIAGLTLPNPIGLAAGFDKNGIALTALSRCGFGFLELGAVTPLAQPGNPRPRFFRLAADQGAINRFGFNNDGVDRISRRLDSRPRDTVIGLNLGANRESHDQSDDFLKVLSKSAKNIDFATVNVSSPNTNNLRDLQARTALDPLLSRIQTANAELERPVPIFLKIAPDLQDVDIGDIAEIAIKHEVSAIIATNTTTSRQGLRSGRQTEKGGLSGKPLFHLSTKVLARLAVLTAGQIPLIGTGGISSPEDAYIKIRAGAHAVQLYTALAFSGFDLVTTIAQGLETLVARDGFANISEAVGVDRDHYCNRALAM